MSKTINRCLIVDTEASGLEDEEPTIELGLILYSVKNRSPLVELSFLLPGMVNNAQYANNIDPQLLIEMMEFELDTVKVVHDMLIACDVLVAHNASFDSKRFDPSFFLGGECPDLRWVCTYEDFKWPKGRIGASLALLALDHGLGVVDAHRALTDCRLIARLFDIMPNLEEMFQWALRPKGLYVGLQRREDNQLAKDAGFKWDRLIKKRWSRRMAIDDAQALPFPVQRVMEDDPLFVSEEHQP